LTVVASSACLTISCGYFWSPCLNILTDPSCSNVLAFRPKTKHATYKDCYFVGASTHPGTGVPICLAGAKITTEQILYDRGQSAPWPKWTPASNTPPKNVHNSKLDTHRIVPAIWFKPLLALIAAIVVFLVTQGYVPALASLKL
jgi:phytoene desaturase (3,4-didehydrolycopene-forming)